MNNTKRKSFYSFSVAIFLYATILIDLYRKIGGEYVEIVRNLFYIISFGLILIDIIKSKHINKISIVGFVVSLIFLVSGIINYGYSSIYISTWFLFVSRLLPAYYIGRYTEDWDNVSEYVSKLSWFALIYSIIVITTPYDGTGNAYATVATNLVFVSFMNIRYAINNSKYIKIGIAIICFIPILFLGTRAVFVGTILSIVLTLSLFINGQSKIKKIFLWMMVFFGSLLVIIYFPIIMQKMVGLLPNSRTLIMLSEGDMLDDSNRLDAFYADLIYSLSMNPLKMYGFLGDRIYLAGANASNETIISSFSHNVILELCMNFGLIIGIIMSIYFLYILYKAFVKSIKINVTINYLFLCMLGVSFVNMMISSSYLGSYYIWLLYGLAYKKINT